MNLNICRCCLLPSHIPLASIFSTNTTRNISFANMISICASVPILQNDGLPDGICDVCMTELKLAYNFRNKCAHSFNELSHMSDAQKGYYGLGEFRQIRHDEITVSSELVHSLSEIPKDLLPQLDEAKHSHSSSKHETNVSKHKKAKSSSKRKTRLYSCVICDISFHNKSYLKKHMKAIHRRCGDYKQFSIQDSSKHIDKHRQEKSKHRGAFLCCKCNEMHPVEKSNDQRYACIKKTKIRKCPCKNVDHLSGKLHAPSIKEKIKIEKVTQPNTSESGVKELLQQFKSLQLMKNDIPQF